MVKTMRIIILLVFIIMATSYAVPNPSLLGSKGLSGLFKGKSDCGKPKEPEHCDSGDGGGDGRSLASAVAISSASSYGGKGKALAKSVAVAESDSNNNDNCD